MPSAPANGITIEYEITGEAGAPPLLLVMGLGEQLTGWPDDFVAHLVDRGFRVIRFDNRDVGCSTWFDEAGDPDVMAAISGHGSSPYLLHDMAADAAGLLDALGVDSAHVVGVSMGGMIAQTLAIEHPLRVRSLVSIMSTPGDPSVGQADPAVVPLLLRAAPSSREEAVQGGIETWRAIGSPGFPPDEAWVRERVERSYDRAFHPAGTGRQLVAILTSGDRTEALRHADVPTLVIHGEADPLVDVSGGRATAAAIPGARLKLVPGMAHDLPAALWAELADDIAGHAHPHDGRLATRTAASPA